MRFTQHNTNPLGGPVFGLLAGLFLCVSFTGCRTTVSGIGGVSNAPSTSTGSDAPGRTAELKPQPSNLPPPPTVTAKAAILVDSRGRVLFEKNSTVRMPTASTQKLLLGILICDSGNLDEVITVSGSDCACEPTKMGIQPGQNYRKGDLLKAVLVRSSNDIARCLARHHSGSVPAFARAMNYKAKQLGMHDSYFTNASGLPTPSGQYSTAKDMVILARAAMARPTIREAVSTRAMVFRFSNGSTKTIYNTNQVLKSNPYCNGCKTGYTNAAGRCLVSSAAYGRKNVIAVVLGSKSPNVWSESDALLRYGLSL